eukprot:jgi/Ulvmu1/12501/UM009_0155.1
MILAACRSTAPISGRECGRMRDGHDIAALQPGSCVVRATSTSHLLSVCTDIGKDGGAGRCQGFTFLLPAYLTVLACFALVAGCCFALLTPHHPHPCVGWCGPLEERMREVRWSLVPRWCMQQRQLQVMHRRLTPITCGRAGATHAVTVRGHKGVHGETREQSRNYITRNVQIRHMHDLQTATGQMQLMPSLSVGLSTRWWGLWVPGSPGKTLAWVLVYIRT